MNICDLMNGNPFNQAVSRMKALNLPEDVIENFKKDGGISFKMENGRRLPLDESDRKRIKRFSEKGYVVYAAIRSTSTLGVTVSYIVVSSNITDWLVEWSNLFHNALLAHVCYEDDHTEDCQQLGMVFIKRLPNGMIERKNPAYVHPSWDLWDE